MAWWSRAKRSANSAARLPGRQPGVGAPRRHLAVEPLVDAAGLTVAGPGVLAHGAVVDEGDGPAGGLPLAHQAGVAIDRLGQRAHPGRHLRRSSAQSTCSPNPRLREIGCVPRPERGGQATLLRCPWRGTTTVSPSATTWWRRTGPRWSRTACHPASARRVAARAATASTTASDTTSLAGRGHGHDAGLPVQRQADRLAGQVVDLAGVDAHPHPRRQAGGPGLVAQRLAGPDGTPPARRRAWAEHRYGCRRRRGQGAPAEPADGRRDGPAVALRWG